MRLSPTDFPVQTYEGFAPRVTALAAVPTSRGWELDQSEGFEERIEEMKERVRTLVSRHEDGTPKGEDELFSEEELAGMCQSVVAQALAVFDKQPRATHFQAILPIVNEDGSMNIQWLLFYNRPLFDAFLPGRRPLTVSETEDLKPVLSVMAAHGNPVEVLRQEVAKLNNLEFGEELHHSTIERDDRIDVF